jgi:hypothetical protein
VDERIIADLGFRDVGQAGFPIDTSKVNLAHPQAA